MFDNFLGRIRSGITHLGKRAVNTASKFLGQAHKTVTKIRNSQPYQTVTGFLGKLGLDKPVEDFADRVQSNLSDARTLSEQYRRAVNNFGKSGDWVPSRFVTKPKLGIERPPDPDPEANF